MAFHYTAAIEEVILDVARQLPEFAHLDTSRILVSIAEARQRTRHGVYAKVFPCRGAWGGAEFSYQERRALYLMYFYLPRFHDQTLEGKVSTIVHECYHISPEFDGSLRRLEGGKPHGRSTRTYERLMDQFARRYLEQRGDWPHLEFLRMSTEELIHARGTLFGLRIQEPSGWPPEPGDTDGPRRWRHPELNKG